MTILESQTFHTRNFQTYSGKSSFHESTIEARPLIYDIRRGQNELCNRNDILEALRPNSEGNKLLPTLLLYDEHGLKLFEKITYLEEYYPTNAEIEVLESNCYRIAERIQDGSRVVELGSG